MLETTQSTKDTEPFTRHELSASALMKNGFIVLTLLSSSLLGACYGNKDEQAIETFNDQASNIANLTVEPVSISHDQPRALAKVGQHEITQTQIDKLIELKLFDLEWAAYELRLKALSTEIEKLANSQNIPKGHNDQQLLTSHKLPAQKHQSVKLLIEPPWPPRINLDSKPDNPGMGSLDAPITLSIFCSYPSSHCAKMTPIYKQLWSHYPEQIRLEFIDFPQSYHFNSGNAAAAAHCAHDGNNFWSFHQGLLSRFDELKSNDVFIRMAQQVGINKDEFTQCLRSQKHMDKVKENTRYAESLGLTKVPVTLVNGLFLNGPKSFDTLRYYIDKELSTIEKKAKTLRIASSIQNGDITPSPYKTLPESKLSMRVESISYSEKPEQASAAIYFIDSEHSAIYQHDDELMDNVFLVMIREDDLVIENNGVLEKLSLQSSHLYSNNLKTMESQDLEHQDNYLDNNIDNYVKIDFEEFETTAQALNAQRKHYRVEPHDVPDDLEYKYRGIIAPKGETPLSRDWIKDQLVFRESLNKHFETTELDVEGYSLLRLTGINKNDFYQTLGLQEKDVIMRVNEQWLHSSQNNLFEELENETDVSIVVMRKGLPVHLHYAIN